MSVLTASPHSEYFGRNALRGQSRKEYIENNYR